MFFDPLHDEQAAISVPGLSDVERRMCFVQIPHGGSGAGAWDAHGGLKGDHSSLTLAIDHGTPIDAILA